MKNLRNRLLMIPVTMILLISIISLLMFNLVISNYVDDQVTQSMEKLKEYHIALDNLQENREKLSPVQKEAREKIDAEMELLTQDYKNNIRGVTTQLLVLDENSEEYRTDIEAKLVEQYEANKEEIAEEVYVQVRIDSETYCISSSRFRAYDSAEKQDVLLYTNISSINAMISSVNRILILSILVSGLIALFAGLFMAKNINKSMAELGIFISSLGEDEKRDKERIEFKEFRNLADNMEQLSDELNAAQKLQKQIFQNASHELRTPLMSIQGYAEGISTNVLKDHKSASDVIITESKKMSELVDEMLYISRMDENPVREEDMMVLELRPIIEDCREEICVIGEKKGVVIIESLDGGNYFIKGDEKQITKALRNVMSNGIRYAQEKLAITGKVEDGLITITVTDDGKGISEKDLPHIFDRFYKGEGGNFGIGLAITKDIILRHGGEIKAVNMEKGARFIITLPAAEVEVYHEEPEIISNGTLVGDIDLEEILKNIPEEDRQL